MTNNFQEQEESSIKPSDLKEENIKADILKEISEEAASFYQFVPVKRDGDALWVGMINPDDIKSKEALRFIAQRRQFNPKIFKISLNDFRNILKQYRTLKEEVHKALKELEVELKKEENVEEHKKTKVEEVAEAIITEAPVTKIVSVILRHALEGRTSDIHIEPIEDRVRVRFRVDGVLYTGLILPRDIQLSVISRIKILANLKIDEVRIPQDGRFHTVIDNKKIDFRVSTFPTVYGEKIVLRLLDSSVGFRSFDEMGLVGHNYEIMKRAIEKPYGMILSTGPTGSGKTTTLYGILRTISREGVNAISLEDPVEYYIESVNQSQVKPEINYSFATGLRSILRQDPDIIMVGEIRDEETANLAVHASLTGHLVLSTLHTNNAIGVIPRLIDMNVPPFLIPSSLTLAIAQRLSRKLCPKCKQEVAPTPKIQKMIEDVLTTIPDEEKKKRLKNNGAISIWKGVGCKFCANKGTQGRIGVFEVFDMTPQLERIIQEGITDTKLKQEALRQNMITMKQDAFLKALEGLISLEEAITVTGQDLEV